jgi:hypothetical protein
VLQVVAVVQARGDVAGAPHRVAVEKLFELRVRDLAPVHVERRERHRVTRDFRGEDLRATDAEDLLETRNVGGVRAHLERAAGYQRRLHHVARPLCGDRRPRERADGNNDARQTSNPLIHQRPPHGPSSCTQSEHTAATRFMADRRAVNRKS